MIKKNIKMRVTPEQSKKVQDICFDNDVCWRAGQNFSVYTDMPFLYIEEGLITFGTEEKYFNNSILEEVDPELFIKTKGTMKLPKSMSKLRIGSEIHFCTPCNKGVITKEHKCPFKKYNNKEDKVQMLTEDIIEVKSESNEILTIELKIIGAIRKTSDGSTELNFKGNKRMILNLNNNTYKTFKNIWVEYIDKRNKTSKEKQC